MTEDTYNGYTNRETWAACLWINNDQGTYGSVLSVALDWIEQYHEDHIYEDADLGRVVLDWLRDELAEVDPEFYQTMSNEVGSWWRVNESEVGANVRESIEVQK